VPSKSSARSRAPKKVAKKVLSPRGRGSVVPARADDQLLVLFALNVRRVRLKMGRTQTEMADAADIDRTYVSGVERALRNVSIRNIQRIADALEVDVRVLFDPELSTDPLWGGELPPKVGQETAPLR